MYANINGREGILTIMIKNLKMHVWIWKNIWLK